MKVGIGVSVDGSVGDVKISTVVEHETSTVTTIIDRSIFVFICLPFYARNYRSPRTITQPCVQVRLLF